MISKTPLAPYRPFGTFRFGLAVMVMLQHGLLLLAPQDRSLFYDLELGAVAVTVFFALSGFIVAEAATSFYAGRPGAFLANRVLRVVPPYLAALALTVVVDAWLYGTGRLVPLDAPLRGSPLAPSVVLGGVLEILPGLTARRVSGQDFSFVPFAWTLRLEFVFYLAAFAVGCLMAWRIPPGWRRALLAAFALAAYATFAVFAARHFGRHGDAMSAGPRQVLCIPFFAFGLCLFLAARQPAFGAWLHLGAVFVAALLAFTFWGQRGHPVLGYQLPLLGVLFAALAVLARQQPASIALRRWDRRLGELSYPLYISHGVVLTVLASVSARRGVVPYMTAGLAALLLAAALHVAVEQPLRGLRTRLRGAAV